MKIFISFALVFSIVYSSSTNFIYLSPNDETSKESTINKYFVKISLYNQKTLVSFSLETTFSYNTLSYYLSEKDQTEEEMEKYQHYKSIETTVSKITSSQAKDTKNSLDSSNKYRTEVDFPVNKTTLYVILSFKVEKEQEPMKFISKSTDLSKFFNLKWEERKLNLTSSFGVYYIKTLLNQSYASFIFSVDSPLQFKKMRFYISSSDKSDQEIQSLNFNERTATITKKTNGINYFLGMNLNVKDNKIFSSLNSFKPVEPINQESRVSSSEKFTSTISISLEKETRYVFVSFNSLVNGEDMYISSSALTEEDIGNIIYILGIIAIIVIIVIVVAALKKKGDGGDYTEALRE